MISRGGLTLLAALCVVASPARVLAQDRSITLFAYGGGYSALKSLDQLGRADFKTGFDLGGGVGFQIDQTVELRAVLTGAQTQLLSDGALTGVYLNRYSLALDLKAQRVVAGGVAPYVLLGVGAVKLHEKGTTNADRTRGLVHFGGGVTLPILKPRVSVFLQGDGFAYSLSQLRSGQLSSYSHAQIDFGLSFGASLRLPF